MSRYPLVYLTQFHATQHPYQTVPTIVPPIKGSVKKHWHPLDPPVQGTKRMGAEKGTPSVFSKYILEGRWDEGVQPVQKKMLDEFMEKYNLQDQDWRKQIKK